MVKFTFSELYWFTICLYYICILQWIYLWINLCSRKELWVFLTHWGWYTCGLVFSNVVISVLFDYMLIDVWHLICVTCFRWDYRCDVVCKIMMWYDISLDKKKWRFRYQGISELRRPMDKRKFRYQGINMLIRPTDELKVKGIIEKSSDRRMRYVVN
jgi:hypothetical protein